MRSVVPFAACLATLFAAGYALAADAIASPTLNTTAKIDAPALVRVSVEDKDPTRSGLLTVDIRSNLLPAAQTHAAQVAIAADGDNPVVVGNFLLFAGNPEQGFQFDLKHNPAVTTALLDKLASGEALLQVSVLPRPLSLDGDNVCLSVVSSALEK